MSLKLVSINIEKSNHLGRVFSFVGKEKPDVLCLQELAEEDVDRFREIFSHVHFVPQTKERERDGRLVVQGIAIASNLDGEYITEYYEGNSEIVPESDASDSTTFVNKNQVLIGFATEREGERYMVWTTHFTWSQRGLPTEAQRDHMRRMLAILRNTPGFALCGDFNAPRGGEIFSMLTNVLKDEIPPHYVWSLDLALHRAGKGLLQQHAHGAGLDGFMVDGLFTTPEYRAENVTLVPGVSDHMAVVATIHKAA